MMILCESDVLRMKGGFIISKWLRRGLLFSKVQCDLLLDKKSYDCIARLRRFGGYEIIRFTDEAKEKEVLELFFQYLKEDPKFLRYYILRIMAKLLVLFFQILLPVYMILHLNGFNVMAISTCTCICLVGEFIFFLMQGLLNRL